jgi:hypothetical protein
VADEAALLLHERVNGRGRTSGGKRQEKSEDRTDRKNGSRSGHGYVL